MCLKELIAFIKFCEDKPVEPVEPIDPIEPVEPEEPIDPIDPVEPIEPPDPIEPEPPTEPDPPQPEFVYEYVIFPQETINVTQRAFSKKGQSHHTLNAMDIAGATFNIEPIYAPTTVKVLAKPTSSANSILYGTCDDNGDPRAVLCEDGNLRILTFNFSHMNDISKIKIGTIYKSGDLIYEEGTAGQATGNHVHVEIGNGWQYTKHYDANRNYCLRDLVNVYDVFHQLNGWNKIKFLNGYTFTPVDSRALYQ